MQIFINNEEVLCSQKMTIKEQLSNTNSVILNNVYPRSWENDKDYVSRFYMPKDYSHCVITDDNVTNEVVQEKKEYIPGVEATQINVFKQRTYNLYNDILESSENYWTEELRLEGYPNEIDVIEITDELISIVNNSSTFLSVRYTDEYPLKEGTTITAISGKTTIDTGITLTDIDKNYKYILLINSIYYSKETNVTINYTPREPETIITTNTYTNNIVFSGVVKNSGNIELNPRKPHYATLQLLDYKTLLSEGGTLDYVLESQHVSEAIEKVVSELEGFEVGVIKLDEDVIIKPYNCDEKTPYDVFEYLAEITGSIWTTTIKDENTVFINFYSPSNIPQESDIEYNEQYFTENNIKDIKYSYSAKDYRNKQTIVSDEVLSSLLQTENISSDGSNVYNVSTTIGEIYSIKSGSVEYSFNTYEEKDIGYRADFYYRSGTKQIESNISYTYGKVFEIKYYPLVTSRQVIYNQTEIDRIASSTGRNGTIARYEKREDTNNAEELNQIAQSYIDYKGVPEITLTIQTYNKDLLNIGQQVFFNGPLESLKTMYLVISKQIDMITSKDQQVLFYTYKLSSSFNDENAINYFDNQRRKLSGNIAVGQYITRYIDVPSTTNIIFYDNSIIETELPNDILDGELDIELIGTETHNAKLEAKLEFKL